MNTIHKIAAAQELEEAIFLVGYSAGRFVHLDNGNSIQDDDSGAAFSVADASIVGVIPSGWADECWLVCECGSILCVCRVSIFDPDECIRYYPVGESASELVAIVMGEDLQGVGFALTLRQNEQTHSFWFDISGMRQLKRPVADSVVFLNPGEKLFVRRNDAPPNSTTYDVVLNGVELGCLPGQLCQIRGSRALVIAETLHGQQLSSVTLTTMRSDPLDGISLPVVDARWLTHDVIVIVTHYCGKQQVLVWSVNNKRIERILEGNGAVEFQASGESYLCFKRSSLVDGTTWHYVDRNSHAFRSGRVHTRADVKQRTGSLGSGSKYIAFAPSRALPRAAVISLHGGPESCEWNNIRYGGLYLELRRAGVAVRILNYRGSSHFGSVCRVEPHGRWSHSFSEDFRDALAFIFEEWQIIPSRVAVFGTSFGGSLAMLSGVAVPEIAQIVAVSPVCDFAAHVEYAEAATNEAGHYRAWFEARFGAELSSLSTSAMLGCRCPTTVIVGSDDLVVDPQTTIRAVHSAQSRGLPWSLQRENGIGHTPDGPRQTVRRFSNVARNLLSALR